MTSGSIPVHGTNPAKVLDTAIVTTSEGSVHREVVVNGDPTDPDALQAVDPTPKAARVVIYDAAGNAITDSAANALKGLLVTEDGVAVSVDDVHSALVFVGISHHEIHNRNSFIAGHFIENVADDASLDILVQVGADNELHMVHEGSAAGDALLDLYEGVTFSAAGTGLTAHNDHRRPTVPVTTATFTHTPTVTNIGTKVIPQHYIQGGTGPKAGGGGFGAREENVLTVSQTYLFRFTNIAGAAKNMAIYLPFYERPAP